MSITKQDINQSVLLRHDSALSQIFFTSSVCTVYQFNLATSQWDKLGVQGTMFLYSRQSTDGIPYAALVLNRNNNSEFNVGIVPTSMTSTPLSVSVEGELVMVRVSDEVIYGLWLFDEKDRGECQGLIQWCLNAASS